MYHQNFNPPSPPPFLRNRGEPDWVPKNYAEKGMRQLLTYVSKCVSFFDYIGDYYGYHCRLVLVHLL